MLRCAFVACTHTANTQLRTKAPTAKKIFAVGASLVYEDRF